MSIRLCCRAAVFVAVLSPLAFPSEASAGRVLSFEIRVDGKDHLAGAGGDNGEGSRIAVWRRLSSTELKPVEGVEIKSNPGDPLRATLRGNIEIEVSYGGKTTVNELRLVRQSPTAGWHVDSEDVERIAKEIGLTDPPYVPSSAGAATDQSPPPAAESTAEKSPWLWVGAGLAMSLFASGFLVSWLRRRMPAPPMVGSAELPFADPE